MKSSWNTIEVIKASVLKRSYYMWCAAKISFAAEIAWMIGSIQRDCSKRGWLEMPKSEESEIVLESNCRGWKWEEALLCCRAEPHPVGQSVLSVVLATHFCKGFVEVTNLGALACSCIQLSLPILLATFSSSSIMNMSPSNWFWLFGVFFLLHTYALWRVTPITIMV